MTVENVGILIVFAVLGAVICAKARVPGGAVVFALIGLVLFVSTPIGSELPGAVTGFLDRVGDSTTPALVERAESPGGAR